MTISEDFVMPDSERLLLDGLRLVFPDYRCAVYLPTDWQIALREAGGLVVARRVGGVVREKRFIDDGMFNVQTYATSRSHASWMARKARAGLVQLTRAQWGNDDGHFSRFREATGPFMTTDPMTEAQPDFSRFTANYMIQTRARRRGLRKETE
ncbi:phage tail termination protein [Kitasatospora sp. McL0602]|uniref:phage tail termination protein n=1 Tax=Kitasatospora sp. McL0602 TaxID=3439530 RepID=UPI003F8CB490